PVLVEDADRMVAEARVQLAKLAFRRRVGAQLVHMLARLRVRYPALPDAAEREARSEDDRRCAEHEPGVLQHSILQIERRWCHVRSSVSIIGSLLIPEIEIDPVL